MNKKKIVLIASIILILVIGSLGFIYFKQKKDSNVNDISSIDTSIDIDNGDEKVDWDSLDKKEITYMEIGSSDIVQYISENTRISQLDELFAGE